MNECRRITASYDRLLGQNQRTLWAMVCPYSPSLRKGGQGGIYREGTAWPKEVS
jgi:hypothetical protein